MQWPQSRQTSNGLQGLRLGFRVLGPETLNPTLLEISNEWALVVRI